MDILVNISYVALGLCPRDNIKPLCNITCVYQLPMYQLLPVHVVLLQKDILHDGVQQLGK